MKWKHVKKRFRAFKRNKFFALAVYLPSIGLALIAYAGYMQNKRIAIDPVAFKPLLELIANAESSDNYNAYFGSSDNTTVKFTDMTLFEVLAWQNEYVRQGSLSSAVGRYQIIEPTLRGLIKEMQLDPEQKFDQSLQDAMALTLLERRGASDFVNNELTSEEFAASLAKEWAALPKVLGDNPAESYYASDGLNKSLVSVEQILSIIEITKPKPS